MNNKIIFQERISSNRTTGLFVLLALIFLFASNWSEDHDWSNWLSLTLSFFFLVFVFYTVNYRTLQILLRQNELILRFGLFTWRVPVENIRACRKDKLPPLLEYGGAGIHFFNMRNRYRVSFNFLEYDRVVVELIKPAGLIKDASFSTNQTGQWLALLKTTRV